MIVKPKKQLEIGNAKSFRHILNHFRQKGIKTPSGVVVYIYPLKRNRAICEQYAKVLGNAKLKGPACFGEYPKGWHIAEITLGTEVLHGIYYRQLQDDLVKHLKKGEINRAFDCVEDLMFHGRLFPHYSKMFDLTKKAVEQNGNLGILALIDEEEQY